MVASPVFDRVNFDDLQVVPYAPAAQAFDWALWCMYEGFTPQYYQLNDGSLPGKQVPVVFSTGLVCLYVMFVCLCVFCLFVYMCL